MSESKVRFRCELIIDRTKLTPAAAQYVGGDATRLKYVRTKELPLPEVRDQFHTGALWTNLAIVTVTCVDRIRRTARAPWDYKVLLEHTNHRVVGVKTLQALKKAGWQSKA